MINCIICEKGLEILFESEKEDTETIPPVGEATVWRSKGNYGSTVFDPMGTDTLEAYICDDCLNNKKKFIYHFDYHSEQKVPWNGE